MTNPSSRPTKVVRVIARLNVGGPARHVVLLDDGLRARGYETLLVHGSIGSGEASLEHLAGARGGRTVKIGNFGPHLRPFGDVRAFAQLVSLIFRESPDVVHTHTAKAGTLGRLAAAAFNATRAKHRRSVVVHTFHGHVLSGYFSPAGSRLVRYVERVLFMLTDRAVTLSPAQRDDIVNRFRVGRPERTTVVPLGLDLEPLLSLGPGVSALRRELDIDARALVVGYVGRFVPVKDLGTLIRAFAAAHRTCHDLILMLAGDGPQRPNLERLAEELGIVSRVRFIGWRDDLAAVYGAMDICAVSSLNEGTPVALIEAMAAGRAVVSTAVGGVPDVVAHGETGLLVSPRAVEELAGALVRLATRPDERARLGAAARSAVAQYSVERLVRDVDRLYREALAGKRGVGRLGS
jgi:glycosyltransferase involved in cell wall biosynthesis